MTEVHHSTRDRGWASTLPDVWRAALEDQDGQQEQSNSLKIRLSVCAFKKKEFSVILFFFFFPWVKFNSSMNQECDNKHGLEYNHFSSWGRGTQARSFCNYFGTQAKRASFPPQSQTASSV